MKEVCGRRPVLARKRESTGYNKCVNAYNASMFGGTRSTTTQNDTPPATTLPDGDEESKARNKKIIIMGIWLY